MSDGIKSTFDVLAYLGQIDVSQRYTVEVLTGGIMNETFRATKLGTLRAGRFAEHISLVIKHAPPFIAGMGDGYPLTTYRQDIEARALSLFHESDKNSIAWINAESMVATPALLHHDSQEHVLIMSDMGDLSNLAAVFAPLVGYIGPPSEENIMATPIDVGDLNSRSDLLSMFGYIGERLGSFFANLHSPRALSALVNNVEREANYLDNPQLGNFAFERIIKSAKENLKQFPDLLNEDEAMKLYDRIVSNCTTPDFDDTCAFALTDCWPGALLVDSSHVAGEQNDAKTPKIAVVDWEFASRGRGLNGDMAQLLAQFSMMECAALCNDDTERGQQLRMLMSTLSKSYQQVSVHEGACWTARAGQPDTDEFAALEPDTLRAKMLRSAFLTYGAEIIHWALIKPWRCRNPACMVDQKHTVVKRECATIQAMVNRAVRYLQHAMNDVDEFCSLENQLLLQQAHKEGWCLLDFF